MSERAKKELDEAMAARRRARANTEDAVIDWFKEFVQALPDEKLRRLYRHFEIITNLEHDGSLYTPGEGDSNVYLGPAQ
jgi:hypothetical protein